MYKDRTGLTLSREREPDSLPLVPGVSAINNSFVKRDPVAESRRNFVKENIKVREYIENNTVPTNDHTWDEKLEKYYKVVPADCYGTLNFRELSQCSSSKFIRFSDRETKPEALYKLMVDHWKVKPPTLLISVTGGAKSFSISPRLKRDFLGGLRKVASTPGAWVISGGTDTGVMKMVGDANRGIENISVGVVTWGVLANKQMLTTDFTKGKFSDECYRCDLGSYLNLPVGLSYLDEHHTHFLLVDDGTVENWGVEIKFRGDFEKYIMEKAKGSNERVPTVLLVLEGGPGTLKTVYNAVKSNTPCVLVKGSGRAADMLVYAIANSEKIAVKDHCKKKYCGLVEEIRKLIGELAPHDTRKIDEVIDDLYAITTDCVLKESIFTIVDQESGLDTDDAILTALLNDPNTSTSDYDKLKFTLHWDRVDLAEKKVLSTMNQWKSKDNLQDKEKEEAASKKELHRLLILALATNNVQFVEILIDYGVSLRSMLTKQVLEILYAHSPPLLSECHKMCQKENVEGLDNEEKDFFLSLSRENDQRSAEKGTPTEVHKIDLSNVKEWLCRVLEDVPNEYLKSVIETPEESGDLFKAPYRQLFIWSVLNNSLDMAVYLWQFVEDSMATSLFASSVVYNIRKILRSGLRNLQDTEEKQLTDSLDAYTRLSFDLLETCHKTNELDSVLLVTKTNSFFDDECSTLDFAFATNQKHFVAHRGIQEILDDVWYGSIKSKHNQFRILATIFVPFLMFFCMDIRRNVKNVDINRLTPPDSSSETDQPDSSSETDQLNFFKKFLCFHTQSPNVRFLEHTVGYILFLVLFSYVAVTKTSASFVWYEILLIITVVGYLFQEVYQMTHINAREVRTKMATYFYNFWNIFDLICITLFFIALVLRCCSSHMGIGHLIYAVDVGLWIVRIIDILYADPISGPYVLLIGKMSKDIMHFLVILLIFVLSYGVSVRAILGKGVQEGNALAPIYRPYFHLFGELFLEEKSEGHTIFNTPKSNGYAEPIALAYLGVYILITNILLLNLLIAIFNSTYEDVMTTASRTWKFHRYQLIVEYAHQRTFCCPPFNMLELVGRLVHWLGTSCTKKRKNAVLSVRRKTGRTYEEEVEALRSLERHSVSKVLRQRQENDEIAKGEESGRSSMAKSELEKKFLEQHDNYESLSEKTERNTTLMLKEMEKKSGEQEKKLKEQEKMLEEQKKMLEEQEKKQGQILSVLEGMKKLLDRPLETTPS